MQLSPLSPRQTGRRARRVRVIFSCLGSSMKREPPEPPSGWLSDTEALAWERKAQDLPLSTLADLRESARRWAASLTSLLGVFGIAAYATGSDTIRVLEVPWNYASGGLVGFALLASLLSAATSALAAQPEVDEVADLDGWTLRWVHEQRSRRARCLLRVARPSGAIALVALLIAVLVIAIAPRVEAGAQAVAMDSATAAPPGSSVDIQV